MLLYNYNKEGVKMHDEHFKYDETLGISEEKATFKGQNYRITVLTERLLRLEYSEGGLFYDGLTDNVLNRKFPVPEFTVTTGNCAEPVYSTCAS